MLQKLGKIHIILSYGFFFLLLGSFFVSINNKDLASVEFKGQFELKDDRKTIQESFENVKTFNFKTNKSYYRDSIYLSVTGMKNTHITVYRLSYMINNNTIYLNVLDLYVRLENDMSTRRDLLIFSKRFYGLTLGMKSIYEGPKQIVIDNLVTTERRKYYSLKLIFDYIKFIPNIENIPQPPGPSDSDIITQQLEKDASTKITTPETSETTVKPVINHGNPIPESEENPSEIDLPVTEEKSSAIDLPAHEEQSTTIDQPGTEGKSSAIDLPASEEKAGEIDTPVIEEKSRAISLPASEEKSGQIHQPVTGEKSSQIGQPVTEEKSTEVDQPESVAERDLEENVLKTEIPQEYKNEDQIELSVKNQKIQNIEDKKNTTIIGTNTKIGSNSEPEKSQILKVVNISLKNESTHEKSIKVNRHATDIIENSKSTSSTTSANKIIEDSKEKDVIEKLDENEQTENGQTIDIMQKSEIGTKTEKSTTQKSHDKPEITLESDNIPIIESIEIIKTTNVLDKNESLTILENNRTTLTQIFISSAQVVGKDAEAKLEIIKSNKDINEKLPLTQIFIFMSILVVISVIIILIVIRTHKKKVRKLRRKQKLLEY